MCNIRDILVFQSVDNKVINQVEQFVRDELPGILSAMKSSGKEINEIDFYGDIHVYKPSSFKFSIGDRMLILRLVEYAKTVQHIEKTIPNDKQSTENTTTTLACNSRSHDEFSTKTHFFLNRLLETADKNASRPKNGYRYDDDIKGYASYYRLLSGPLAYKTLQKNLPCALPSLPTVNRHIRKTNCRVIEGIPRFDELNQYLEERNHEKVVALSEDGTRIVGRIQYDKYTNQIIGFTLPLNESNGLPVPFSFPARNAPEIMQHFSENNTTSALVNVIMARPISKNPPPAFCLLVYGTDNKYTALDVCKRWQYIVQKLKELGIKVLCISSDSDPRYNSAMKMLSNLGHPSKNFPDLNWFCCGDVDLNNYQTIYIQDPIHLATKMRNLLLKTINFSQKLPCGKYFVQQSHLKQLIQMFSKDKHNLSPMVLNPIDKQNFESVLRICDDKVIKLLNNHIIGSQATVKFLTITKYFIDAFMDSTLMPLERVYKCWYSVFFIRLWRDFVYKNKQFTLKDNFITSNTYNCIELNAHSLILSIVQLKKHNMPHLFLPQYMESQACESIFRQLRSFTTTGSTVANCSVKEILQRISKIQFQSDTATRIGSKFVFPQFSRNENINNATDFELPAISEIVDEIERARNHALIDATVMGLVSKQKSHQVDFSCKLKPYTKKRIVNKNTAQTSNGTNIARNFIHTMLHMGSIALKNYADKFGDDKLEETESFVEVFRSDENSIRIIVKKTSFCWLLRGDNVRLSTDRLERVKAEIKTKRMYNSLGKNPIKRLKKNHPICKM